MQKIKVMQNLIYIILLLWLGTACQNNPQKVNNKPHAYELTQNIKACKIYSSDFAILNPNERGSLIQEFRFSNKGYVNELIRYDMNGEILARFDITGENTPFPLPGAKEYMDTVLTVIEFDKLGAIKHKEIRSYNADGFLIEVNIRDADNSLINKNTYEYHPNGLIHKDIYWDTELDKPKQIIWYEYEFITN
ncbi:MAG: hypothetical protein CVU09_11730 [Bacteroidetes bacterium HGW-Bacteroidetes-4]|jgi:hypothetical protein|nr:MAG: hypothetical protein CVU09_11730 [Bacteroidetes bacterium HGW-Bacteroidetes-4]